MSLAVLGPRDTAADRVLAAPAGELAMMFKRGESLLHWPPAGQGR